MPTAPNIHRQRFFANSVHHPKVKDCMSGENESKVFNVIENLGFKLGTDFVRQHPIGCRFVIDIAFVNEQVAIEVDGDSHNAKRQRKIDKARDRFIKDNNWVSIRIKDKEMFGYKGSFYKSLIRFVVAERRKQWKEGRLYAVNIPEYESQDYEREYD